MSEKAWKNIPVILSLTTFLVASLACNRSVSEPPNTPPPEITIVPTPTPLLLSQPTIQPTDTLVPPSPTAPVVQLAGLYAVVMLGEGDLLNVRAGAGTGNDVLETLGPEVRDLLPTGNIEETDGIHWVEIQREGETTGWVSRAFLTEQVTSQAFCDDERAGRLIGNFAQAVKEQNGEALARLVSPEHGLTIQHNWWNPAVTLDSTETVQNLFFSTTDFDWGTAGGSGEPLVGSFRDIVLPMLRDVIDVDYSQHCNLLESGTSAGGTTGQLTWPVEYANLNFYALFRAAPAGEEMNWRTWAVGIEYVGGVPYLAVLIQYDWEI
jgi:hypothetical protein